VTRHYCCYFDHRYLPRGLAMIRSLRRFERDSPVWVLCLDDECHEMLSALREPGVRPIRLSELEAGDEALAAAKSNRSRVEYYFTMTPSLVLFVLDRAQPEDTVTYVDGDLFFFSDPAPLHQELGEKSVSIIPHRFPDHLRHLEQYGIYNVGWLTFRNDAAGRTVASWWRDRCNEWCYDAVEPERFADQKYLDRFPKQFERVAVLKHPGANLAPWNLRRHRLRKSGGALWVDDQYPLVFFHFHGLRAVGRFAYLVRHYPYGAPFAGTIRRELYRPYIERLRQIEAEIGRLGHRPIQTLMRNDSALRSRWKRLTASLRRLAHDLPVVARAHVILVFSGRAY
jgi:hypothetical protein